MPRIDQGQGSGERGWRDSLSMCLTPTSRAVTGVQVDSEKEGTMAPLLGGWAGDRVMAFSDQEELGSVCCVCSGQVWAPAGTGCYVVWWEAPGCWLWWR